jgi:hypothetical protein
MCAVCTLMRRRLPVEAEIRISRGGIAEFTALWEWLRGERALAGTVRAVPEPPGSTDLGGVYDILVVALGSGGAGVALAKSLTAWLQTRRSDIAITVTTPSGGVTVDAHKLKDTEIMPLLHEVLRARDES